MSFLLGFLTVVFVLSCILLIIIVLVQPHHSESGLAGAFGGGGSDSFFGTHAVSVATKVTVVLAIIFIILAILLNKMPRYSHTLMQDKKAPSSDTTTQKEAETQTTDQQFPKPTPVIPGQEERRPEGPTPEGPMPSEESAEEPSSPTNR